MTRTKWTPTNDQVRQWETEGRIVSDTGSADPIVDGDSLYSAEKYSPDQASYDLRSFAQKFEWMWAMLGGPELEKEYRFHPDRKWRADYRCGNVLIELEGGVWSGGRHTRAQGFIADAEKYNAAAALGYVVFRLATGMLQPGHIEPIIDFIRVGTD